MIYRLRNVTTGAERLCGTEQEAHERVIDIVSCREEWVIEIPQQSGVTFTVARGIGPVPYGPLLARLMTRAGPTGAPARHGAAHRLLRKKRRSATWIIAGRTGSG